MKNTVFFISDLHLGLDKPEITAKFLAFLNQYATQTQALYILGDFFDVWIGDDDFSPPIGKVKKALRQLTDSGVQVFLQRGNRDFLIGEKFCQQTGVYLLADYAVIELNGVKTLLTHGDLLCTDDLAYQAFRKKSRNPEWQQNVLSKPLLLRLLAARWYRVRSFFHKRKKADEIMDVNPYTVLNVMREQQVFNLIHGHTHRPTIHDLEIDGKPAKRFVLSEWKKDSATALCWDNSGFNIINL